MGHLPYKRETYESYVGNAALLSCGKKRWRHYVADVVARLAAALEPDEVVLGGGNAKELKDLPPKCRLGDNRDAFQGGFLLWEHESEPHPLSSKGSISSTQSTGKDEEHGSTSGSNGPAPSKQTPSVEGARVAR
jgi:hypothetical protein